MNHSANRQHLNAALRQHLVAFTRKVFHTLNPGQNYQHNWHIERMVNELESCRTGGTKRLIINLPPRSLKSICVSVAFPAFALGHDPGAQIICVSYSTDLALKHARDFRKVVESDWYRAAFPNVVAVRNTEHSFETTRGGGRLATSVGGTITGLGGNYIILDDPQKPDESFSKPLREKVNEYFSTTLYSRLDNKQEGVIILVMQRLHAEDLSGYLLKQDGWTHLRFTAIAEHDELITTASTTTIGRRQGEALHPEREPVATLEQIKRTMGSLLFSAQYQQSPVPEAGNLVRGDWIRFYDRQPERMTTDRIVQSWDTANKGGTSNDYSVCTTWLVRNTDYHLLDVSREQHDYPSLKRLAIELHAVYRPNNILIEDCGAGSALIQELKLHHGIAAIPIKPKADKITRFATNTGCFEAGQMHLPREAVWLATFIQELLLFPQSRFDDQVDSVSQFLGWIRERDKNVFEFDFGNTPEGKSSSLAYLPHLLLWVRR